jgi:ribosomal-protein-alanine N-acetyltransferase
MATRARRVDAAIRTAREADVDDVAAIERAVFKDPWSRRSFADLVDQKNVIFLVATDGAAVSGYAIVLLAGDESELANLAVARLAQRQGVGNRLLQESLRRARGRGCRRMFLEVRESNAAAIALYEREGFDAIGRRARYYARPIEDAIVMTRRLDT